MRKLNAHLGKSPLPQNKSGERETAIKSAQAGFGPATVARQSARVSQLAGYSTIANGGAVAQRKTAQNDGLPTRLKTGIESLSGIAMDDVRVHYNSDKPAQLQAHAFAQGSDIHLAAGQEKHLAHEAWHVVQQKQGRVKPTLQLKGVAINDDTGLEREADVMGGKAMGGGPRREGAGIVQGHVHGGVLQPMWIDGTPMNNENGKFEHYHWHQKIQGLVWHLLISEESDRVTAASKKVHRLYYEMEDKGPTEDAYWAKNAGVEHARTLEQWLSDPHWEGTVAEEQSSATAPDATSRAPVANQKSGMKARLDNLGNDTEVKAVRNLASGASKATLNTAGMVNMQCEKFAVALQEKMGSVKYLSILFKVADPKGIAVDKEISIQDPLHPYHGVEVGSDYHFATFVHTPEGWFAFDNHHIDGTPVPEYLASLQFDLIKIVDSHTGTGSKAASSASVAEKLVRVFLQDGSKGKVTAGAAAGMTFNEFKAYFSG